MNKADTRRLNRAQKIAGEVIRLIREDVAVSDADADVFASLHDKSTRASFKLPRKCLDTYDWALCHSKLSVDLYFACMARHSYSEGLDGGQWDVIFSDHRDKALVNAKEILGLLPASVRQRERESWTRHWVSLCQNPNLSSEDRDGVVEAALEMYPDFDLSLLGVELTNPVSQQYAREQVQSILSVLGDPLNFETARQVHNRLYDLSAVASPWPKEIVEGTWEDDLLESSILSNILSAALSRSGSEKLVEYTRSDLVGLLRKLSQ